MTTADGAIQGVEESTSAAEAKIRTWALVALILYLVSGAAFVGFLSVGGIWATISDSVGLFLARLSVGSVLPCDPVGRAGGDHGVDEQGDEECDHEAALGF